MIYRIEENGLRVKGVNAYKPPLVRLNNICKMITKKFGIAFTGGFEGNNDKQEMFFPFVNDIEEDAAVEIQDFLDED